ncbi:MAG: cytochrome c [Pseudohongiella sp.]|nr:cytochrome c [Pseudohongiella sp.]MDP2128806.1 cytochrome c [Pseudohongiella sp.]
MLKSNRFKKILAVSALALTSAAIYTASAQDAPPPTPEQIAASSTATRQAVFKLLAFNMAPINGMARNTVEFDAVLAQRNALRVAALAPMIPEVFATNDTRAFGVTTEALPIIWDNMDDFRAKAAALEEAANTFAAVAAGGDRAATIGAIRAFGSTCGNCHREYRVD